MCVSPGMERKQHSLKVNTRPITPEEILAWSTILLCKAFEVSKTFVGVGGDFLHSQCVEFWLSMFAHLRHIGLMNGGFLENGNGNCSV